jgi:hypothetical protein
MTPSYHLTGQAAVVTGAFAGMGMAAHADPRAMDEQQTSGSRSS